MIIGISGKIGSGKDTVAQIWHYLNAKDRAPNPVKQSVLNEDFNPGISYEDLSLWETKRWAGKLKDIACMLIGCTREQLEDREFKEAPLGEEWDLWIVNPAREEALPIRCTSKKDAEETAETYGIKFGSKKRTYVSREQMTPRKMLQLLGTEAGREVIHPNIWVNALMAEYEGVCQVDYHDNAYAYRYCGCEGECDPDYMVYPNWLIPDTRFPNEAKAVRERDGILIRINRIKDPREDMIGTDLSTWKAPSSHPSETALDNWDDWDYIIQNDGDLNDLLTKVKEIYEDIQT